ncbi:MAG: hypothetical protein V3T77_04865, partial [Planctomycetota bacterium]
RSLPPILDLVPPDEEDNPTGSFVITRYAYSEGAYHLLEDLLEGGHVFSMNSFLEFVWSLAQSLAFLHRYGIVHGQWNSRSVMAIPVEDCRLPFGEDLSYHYQIINSGVCFRNPESVPREYLERGYYPPEVLLAATGTPDYGAIDLQGDVYCFCAFLKDLLQRACSTEELASQATRILDDLQKKANSKGWKAAPEKVRQKELEILDHLYTIKVRTEGLIQEGSRDREHRCTAEALLKMVEELYEKSSAYSRELFEHGFEPINVFGNELQHYTAFQLTFAPERVNNFENSQVILRGSGLPHELVRVTLNERDQGVHMLSAEPGRIEFQVSRGFPVGSYKITINNRRTNGVLEVFSPVWEDLLPREVHQPWPGFGNLKLRLTGAEFPKEARYSLREFNEEVPTQDPDEEQEVLALSVRSVASTIAEKPSTSTRTGAEAEPAEELAAPQELQQLQHQTLECEFPPDTFPAHYELFANGLPTGLRILLQAQLPEPFIDEGALDEEEIKNHRPWHIRVSGRNLHPNMLLDFGESTPEGLRCVVESASEASLTVPAGFPPGEYRLRLNYNETDVQLRVVEPSWKSVKPSTIKLYRDQKQGSELIVSGDALPPLTPEREGYGLITKRGVPLKGAVLEAEEIESEKTHRLVLAPDLHRGRPRIRFGGHDTGLHLQIRRQLPRTVQVGISLLILAGLAGLGMHLEQRFAPRVASLAPAEIFNHGQVEVEVEGAYLSAIGLVAQGGGSEHMMPLKPIEGREGWYRFTASGLEQGSYDLRPVGPFYSKDVTAVRLTVRSPEFSVRPATLHRHRDTLLRVTSMSGYPLEEIQILELSRPEASAASFRIPLLKGATEITPGTLPRGAEGEYQVSLDGIPVTTTSMETGEPIPLTLNVLGSSIQAITPNPATLDNEGRITLQVEGENLLQDLWIGLVPDGEEASVAQLFSAGGRRYDGRAESGSYSLLWGMGENALEPIPDLRLRVFPPPTISAVTPTKLDPGQESTVRFTGINLGALKEIVIRPVSAQREEAITIAINPDQLLMEDELRGTYRAEGVTLPTGSYRVEPAEEALSLEVYDNCSKLVVAFEEQGGDGTELLRCLKEERPSPEVIEKAADLFFDRGLFAESRQLYASSPQLWDRFRSFFVQVYVEGSSEPVFSVDENQLDQPYAIAAVRLGWTPGTPASFPADVSLPWELEFVRGITASDPHTTVDGLLSCIEKKTRASGGHEVQEFAPARERLLPAYLELALLKVRLHEVEEALSILREKLFADADLAQRLSAQDRARARFWYAHLLLWYQGDEAGAVASLKRGAALAGAGDAGRWCQLYLRSFGEDSGELGESAGGTSWEEVFLSVHRDYKEISEHPNYNLLTEKYDFSVYLPAEERKKSLVFHRSLRALEKFEDPVDPFAHYAVLYYLRNAQRISWPAQKGGLKAAQHRNRLVSLLLPEPESMAGSLHALREYYLISGEVGPMDSAQIAVLPPEQRQASLERLQALEKKPLPVALKESARSLKSKLSTSTSVGSSE